MNPREAPILLVEDDHNDVLFMKMAFDAVGVLNPLEVVADGKQAMEYLKGATANPQPKKRLPYLMLLDLKLPHLMGLDLLKWVRDKPELNPVVIVVLTSSANPADIDRAYQLGANAYLVKPSSFQQLQDMVRALKDFWLTQNRPGTNFNGG